MIPGGMKSLGLPNPLKMAMIRGLFSLSNWKEGIRLIDSPQSRILRNMKQ